MQMKNMAIYSNAHANRSKQAPGMTILNSKASTNH